MRPVRLARTGYALAVPARVTVFAAVVVVGEASVGDVPHVNEIDANEFPLPVRWPLSVADVDNTLVAAVVVDDGAPQGVANVVVLSTPVFVEVIARMTTRYSVPFTRSGIEIGLAVEGDDKVVNVSPPFTEYW